jgi:hypothetical protein
MASANTFQFTFDIAGLMNLIGTIAQVSALLAALRTGAAAGVPGAAQAIGPLQGGLSLLKFNLAVSAAVFVLSKLNDVVSKAAERLLAFSTTTVLLGSSGAVAGRLEAMGRAFGFDAASAARRLQQASLTPVGAGMLSQLGQGPMFQFGNEINRGQALTRILTKLSDMLTQGEGARVRGILQTLGWEDLYNVILALQDPKTRETFDEIGKMRERLNTPEAQARAGRYSVELQKLSATWEVIVQSMGQRFLPLWNTFLRGIDIKLHEWFGWLLPKGGADANKQAMDAQTKAMMENTEELRRTNGIRGGGRRAGTAIPGAFGPGMGWALNQSWSAANQKLGAFSISM